MDKAVFFCFAVGYVVGQCGGSLGLVQVFYAFELAVVFAFEVELQIFVRFCL